MTALLPPNLLRLFAPRPPLPYLQPMDKDPMKRKRVKYSGISQYVREFEKPMDYTPTETKAEEKARKKREKAERIVKRAKEMLESWDPSKMENATADPYKTLFVSNLSYETTEKQLRKTMEVFGDVKQVSNILTEIAMVKRKESDKPTGYAFVEFERESGMKAAYHECNGVKLNDRRMIVDVERGRTTEGWKPKKLGGGLGKKRAGYMGKPRSAPMPNPSARPSNTSRNSKTEPPANVVKPSIPPIGENPRREVSSQRENGRHDPPSSYRGRDYRKEAPKPPYGSDMSRRNDRGRRDDGPPPRPSGENRYDSRNGYDDRRYHRSPGRDDRRGERREGRRDDRRDGRDERRDRDDRRDR